MNLVEPVSESSAAAVQMNIYSEGLRNSGYYPEGFQNSYDLLHVQVQQQIQFPQPKTHVTMEYTKTQTASSVIQVLITDHRVICPSIVLFLDSFYDCLVPCLAIKSNIEFAYVACFILLQYPLMKISQLVLLVTNDNMHLN